MACNFLLDHTAPNYSKQLPVYKSFPCNFVQLGFQIPVLKFILTSFIFLFLRSDLLILAKQYDVLEFRSHIFIVHFNFMLSTNFISKIYLYLSKSLVKILTESRLKHY